MLFSRSKFADYLLLFEVDLLMFEVYLFSQKKRFFGGMSGKREIYLHNSEKSCTFAGKIDMKGNKTQV